MKLISINVGRPREVVSHGEPVVTGIFKQPVDGVVAVRRLNVAGDEQADLSVHGGPDKAVYAYPLEHYDFWRNELGLEELPFGAFGENLTTEGLIEAEVNIGDQLRIGTAEFVVTQPRMPCFKLGIRFNRPDMVKRFLASGRTGFYLRVLQEGEVEAGNAIVLLARDAGNVSVADIVVLYAGKRGDQELLRRASQAQALPEAWREWFAERLEEPEA